MSLPVWPEDLPRPNREGWQAQNQDARLARAAETGPRGMRRRFSSAAREVSLAMTLTRTQKGTFDRFLREDLRGAVLPFWMPDPTTEGWPLATEAGVALLGGDGAPILMSARWLCVMGQEMPRETISGVRFVITFSVSVLP